MSPKNYPPHIVDEGASYQQKVEEAPYHPGYEDAVITPTPKYTGMDPTKMLWKPKPLSDEEIQALWTVKHPNVMSLNPDLLEFARAIEERHGIK